MWDRSSVAYIHLGLAAGLVTIACGTDSNGSASQTDAGSGGASTGGASTDGPTTGAGSPTAGGSATDTPTTTSDGTDGPGSTGTGGGPGATTGDVPPPGEPPPGDVVTYAAATRFNRVVRLSDGTFLVTGQTSDLDWIAAEVPRIELSADGLDSASAGNIGFILHLSADLQVPLHVAHFPAGTVRDVTRIRTTEVPGQKTGDMFVSGRRDTADPTADGYYIGKLDGNFVDAAPTGFLWIRDIAAPKNQASGYTGDSSYKHKQPWDVGGDGKVVYGTGCEYDYKWAAIERFDGDGAREKVPGWPGQEWPDYSAIVMKAGRKGSLRSKTQAEFDALLPDGNGRADRKGTYPDDYYFSGPCPDVGDCAGAPGYTGYKPGDRPTQRVGDIVIDRRDNAMYFGYSTQSVLPDDNPDFEPAVVATHADGHLLWWSRLYHERIEKDGGYYQNSTPDQYVDDLDIDYGSDRLVVLARAHGNNVINYWAGNKIAAEPDASGFQNSFTGSNGNIHISWLGKLALADGALHASTYVAEYVNGDTNYGEPFASPHLAGWPNPNSGWPDVNTTRCSNSEITVGPGGRVHVPCAGRRTITTRGAYQEMLLPGEGSSTWNAFARVYTPELDDLVYSTLLVGTWDPVDGAGGGNTELFSIAPVGELGFVTVGFHGADNGVAKGNKVPTAAIPPWGKDSPTGESALLGFFRTDGP